VLRVFEVARGRPTDRRFLLITAPPSGWSKPVLGPAAGCRLSCGIETSRRRVDLGWLGLSGRALGGCGRLSAGVL